MTRALAWGRLLRLSLAVTAVGDALAGSALALEGGPLAAPGAVALLACASLGVYHGGMVLNDWADRAHDARVGRPRPLPAGEIAPGAALAAALALFALGVLCAWAVAPRAGLWMLGVAACAALYDLVGRGPWRGPLLLAACRAGDLAAPLVAFAPHDARTWAAAPLAYGLYVFVVSRLGRYEDEEAELGGGAAPRRLALGAALLLLALPALPLARATWLGRGAAALLLIASSVGALRAVRAVERWTRGAVERCMGVFLRRLLLAAAALAALPGDAPSLATAALLLCGYPLARALRGVFPPS